MARPAASNVVVQWIGTGTGTLSLGSAVPGSQGFPAALSGFKVSYSIEHENGSERESGLGTYTSSGNSLTRDLVDFATVPGAGGKHSFTAGTKFVRLTIMPRDTIEDRRTTNPGLTDDINAGYIEGRSVVLNTATGAIYMCRSHAPGAAVWDRINAAAGGASAPPTSIITTAYQILLTDGPVRTNTAATGFQVTAPVSPADGQLIALEDAAEGGSWTSAKPVTLVTSDGSTLAGNIGAVGVAHDGGTKGSWRYNSVAADWGYVGQAGGASGAAPTVPAGYTLVFSDEFNYVGPPDPTKWLVESAGHTDPSYATVDGSKLIMRATATSFEDRQKSSIRTSDSDYMTWWTRGVLGLERWWQVPGWIEMRMKPAEHVGVISIAVLWTDFVEHPVGSGIWELGEIDIIEARGFQPGIMDCATHAWTEPIPGGVEPDFDNSVWYNKGEGGAQNVGSGYHRYVCSWDATSVNIYVDDVLIHSRTLIPGDPYPIFGEPMMLQLECASGLAGDGWIGAAGVDYPLDVTMEVDYVRVYQGTITPDFALSPAVAGRTSWSLDAYGPLTVDGPGTWTITPTSIFDAVVELQGPGGSSAAHGSVITAPAGTGTASTFSGLSAGAGAVSIGTITNTPSVGGAGGAATGGDTNEAGLTGGTGTVGTTSVGGFGAAAASGGAQKAASVASGNGVSVDGGVGNAPGGGAAGSAHSSNTVASRRSVGGGGSGARTLKSYSPGVLTAGNPITLTVGGSGAAGTGNQGLGAKGAAGHAVIRRAVIIPGGFPGLTGRWSMQDSPGLPAVDADIAQWQDFAGNSRHWSVDGVRSLPAHRIRATFPAAEFVAANADSLRQTISTNDLRVLISFTGLLAVVVELNGNPSATGASFFNCNGVFADAGGFYGLYARTSGGVPQWVCGIWDGVGKQNVHTATTGQRQLVMMWRTNTGQFASSVNGGAVTSIAAGSPTVLSHPLRIGFGYGSGSQSLNGWIYEIFTSTATGSSDDRAALAAHFISKWSIP